MYFISNLVLFILLSDKTSPEAVTVFFLRIKPNNEWIFGKVQLRE